MQSIKHAELVAVSVRPPLVREGRHYLVLFLDVELRGCESSTLTVRVEGTPTRSCCLNLDEGNNDLCVRVHGRPASKQLWIELSTPSPLTVTAPRKEVSVNGPVVTYELDPEKDPTLYDLVALDKPAVDFGDGIGAKLIKLGMECEPCSDVEHKPETSLTLSATQAAVRLQAEHEKFVESTRRILAETLDLLGVEGAIRSKCEISNWQGWDHDRILPPLFKEIQEGGGGKITTCATNKGDRWAITFGYKL